MNEKNNTKLQNFIDMLLNWSFELSKWQPKCMFCNFCAARDIDFSRDQNHCSKYLNFCVFWFDDALNIMTLVQIFPFISTSRTFFAYSLHAEKS